MWETSSQETQQEKERANGEEGGASSNVGVQVELNSPEAKKTKTVQWRERFVRNLKSAGLLMEKVLQDQMKSPSVADLQRLNVELWSL